MELFGLLAILGCIPGAIAQAKGRGFFGFWLYGVLLFPIALIHALVMRRDEAGLEQQRLAEGSHRKCPFCAEVIKLAAVVCRYCGRDLPPPPPGAEPEATTARQRTALARLAEARTRRAQAQAGEFRERREPTFD